MGKIAWVAGASGLVGNELVTQLATHPDYDKIVALVRKPLQGKWSQYPRVEQCQIDYSKLDQTTPQNSVDVLFCALGTTKRKTPDKDAYFQIDVQLPLDFAETGIKRGARFYGLVSAHGASTRSFSAYLRLKGQLEAQLEKLPLTHIAIARPGLLKGEREEFRLGERLAEKATDLLPGNYRSIHARDVAAALIAATSSASAPKSVLASSTMQGAYERSSRSE